MADESGMKMTNRERAEKIAQEVQDYFGNLFTEDGKLRPQFVYLIAAQLDEACQEAYELGKKEPQFTQRITIPKDQQRYTEGFLACQAKGMEALKEDCEGTEWNENCDCCACQHADRLRKLEP